MEATLVLSLLGAALYASLWFIATIIVGGQRGALQCRWAVLGIAYVALGQAAIFMPTSPLLDFDQWNWQGKILQSMLALSSIFFIGAHGLFGDGGWSVWLRRSVLCLFLAVVALAALVSMVFDGGLPESHRLLFQLTMPGLGEELFYRGCLLALTHKAIPGTHGKGAVLASYGVVQVMFCFSHVIYPVHGVIVTDVFAALSPLLIGILLCGLRYASRSVWPAVIAHNVFNGA